mgnify:CR=1 FL=1
MYGNCTWYQLSSTHSLNSIINNFCQLFGYNQFNAHMTIEYNVDDKIDTTKYSKYNFVKHNNIYKTLENNIYCIQQDYITEEIPKKIYHISLAYKQNSDFTIRETEFLNSMKLPDRIKKEEITIHLWNCNSANPKKWKLIK